MERSGPFSVANKSSLAKKSVSAFYGNARPEKKSDTPYSEGKLNAYA